MKRTLASIPLVLLAAAAAAEEPDLMLAEIGAPYFAKLCASCHGIDATGKGPSAASLRVPPADLTRIAARRGGVFPEGEIARFIDGRFEPGAHGSREMPVWGQRLGEDIPDAGTAESIARGKVLVIVEYLKSIQVDETAGAGGERE